MLNSQKNYLTEQLKQVIEELEYEYKPVQPEWRNIPFLGALGLATSVSYRLAAQELEGVELAKKEKKSIIQARALEIAEEMVESLQSAAIVGRVEAQKGYINFYFDIPTLASQLIESVLSEAQNYGRGSAKPERIMVEYSQPNTHKAFHVGHLRNVCLGHSLSLILDFAGYDTVPVNYIGDIGMHVIRCLWCYTKFHEGQEPSEGRGKWLGQVYVEAGERLELHDHAVALIRDLAQNSTFQAKLHRWIDDHLAGIARAQLLYKLDAGWQEAVEIFQAGLENGKPEADDSLVEENLQKLSARGAALFHPRLKDLTSGKSFQSALDILQQIVDEDKAASLVREYVPSLWSEMGSWISEQEQLALFERYHILDSRMAWWPEVAQWQEEVKVLFLRWDAQEPAIVKLWEKTREWSIEEFRQIYDFLGAKFDIWFYESEVEEEGKVIVSDMVEKGIAEDLRDEGGPVLVHIDELLSRKEPEYYDTLLILRSDGTSLYSTKDLALAKRKFEDYGVDTSIYVVDVRQAFYFKQVFKVLELWGFEQAKNCYHLAYEIVTDPTGAMSSRSGRVIPFEDFAETAIERALAEVDKKNPDLTDHQKREIARVVALGAMKFSMLSVDDNKVIVFDLDEALSFDGRSAPYIQYAHARACRILQKAGAISDLEPDYSYLSVPTDSKPASDLLVEVELIEKIGSFPDVVLQAATSYKPHLVATYVFELATLFANFYHRCDVLRGEIPDGMRAARLQIVRATIQTLANGLSLLGIEAPEVM